MTGDLVIDPQVETIVRRARIAAEQRSQPAIGHAPNGSRGCATCGLPVPRVQGRCPPCAGLRQVADGLAARSSLLANRPDGRALAERIVVAAVVLDLDRRPVEQLATVELIEAGLSAEVGVLRFALSLVVRSSGAIVTREPYGHLLPPHLAAAAGAIVAPHDRHAARARLERQPPPAAPLDRVEALRARLSAARTPPGARVPEARETRLDTMRHGPAGIAGRHVTEPDGGRHLTSETSATPSAHTTPR